MTPSEPLKLLPDSVQHRRTMVDRQIRTFDVTDPRVIGRFLDVPRELFLPAELKDLAYSDTALDIGAAARSPSRQLLPPLVLAKLLQNASLKLSDKVLDVASGTGYSTALLAGIAGTVIALESDLAYAALVSANLQGFELSHVKVATGPLAAGLPQDAPYDVILVNGTVEAELDHLIDQLGEGGRLLAIQRFPDDPSGHASKAVRFEKVAGKVSSRPLFDASGGSLAEFRKVPQFVF